MIEHYDRRASYILGTQLNNVTSGSAIVRIVDEIGCAFLKTRSYTGELGAPPDLGYDIVDYDRRTPSPAAICLGLAPNKAQHFPRRHHRLTAWCGDKNRRNAWRAEHHSGQIGEPGAEIDDQSVATCRACKLLENIQKEKRLIGVRFLELFRPDCECRKHIRAAEAWKERDALMRLVGQLFSAKRDCAIGACIGVRMSKNNQILKREMALPTIA
ncbi:hypothetical protein DBR21_12740 [Caulobacter sp. HMWF009]|nr:hypothetical protein DBR21_12740 [Caulobacter sp. HMWF009]PTT05706.1 hypothetical protein DBR10_14875 [Caulobacter sp. HMWF025]